MWHKTISITIHTCIGELQILKCNSASQPCLLHLATSFHSYHTLCPLLQYTWERIFLMPDPSVAVFCRSVQPSSIHCVTEGHLVMCTVVINSLRKRVPLWRWGMERKVEGKVTPSGDGLLTICDWKSHIVPYNYKTFWILPLLPPFLSWHKSFIEVIK